MNIIIIETCRACLPSCVHELTPAYMVDAVQPVADLSARQRELSSSCSALDVHVYIYISTRLRTVSDRTLQSKQQERGTFFRRK